MKTSTKRPRVKTQPVKFLKHLEDTEPPLTKLDIELLRNDMGWVKRFIGALLTAFIALGGLMTYLHNDTSSEIRALRSEMKELRSDTNDLKLEIHDLRSDTGTRFDRLEKLILQKR